MQAVNGQNVISETMVMVGWANVAKTALQMSAQLMPAGLRW